MRNSALVDIVRPLKFSSPSYPPLWFLEPVVAAQHLCVRRLAGHIPLDFPGWLGRLSRSRYVVHQASAIGQGEEDGALQSKPSLIKYRLYIRKLDKHNLLGSFSNLLRRKVTSFLRYNSTTLESWKVRKVNVYTCA